MSTDPQPTVPPRACMERVGCYDYRHGTDCPMYDWPRSLDLGRPL